MNLKLSNQSLSVHCIHLNKTFIHDIYHIYIVNKKKNRDNIQKFEDRNTCHFAYNLKQIQSHRRFCNYELSVNVG